MILLLFPVIAPPRVKALMVNAPDPADVPMLCTPVPPKVMLPEIEAVPPSSKLPETDAAVKVANPVWVLVPVNVELPLTVRLPPMEAVPISRVLLN